MFEADLFDDDADTILEIVEPLQPIVMLHDTRAATANEWPPEPPPPAALDEVLAVGTQPPARRAKIYAAVRRPTTSGDAT